MDGQGAYVQLDSHAAACQAHSRHPTNLEPMVRPREMETAPPEHFDRFLCHRLTLPSDGKHTYT